MKIANGWVILFVMFHHSFLFCAASDAITINKPIRDGEHLISSENSFALGFFTPGKSNNRYVGIWYNNLPEPTVVWVANRDDPINDTSGVLSISSDGNLVLHRNYSDIPIWSTNVSVPVPNTTVMAQLTDIGNFVLTSQNDSKTVLWQSFDHLSDTLLPYGKLGVNRRTGQSWFLQSWKAEEDPGTGNFTMKFNVNGKPQLFLYNNYAPWWRAGSYNGEMLVGIPFMKRAMSTYVTIPFSDDGNEVKILFHPYDKKIIMRVVAVQSGFFQALLWDNDKKQWNRYWSGPEVDCDNYGSCGANGNCDPLNYANFRCSCLPGFEPKNPTNWYQQGDPSEGCVRTKGPSLCGNGEGFVKVESVKIPDTSVANSNMTMSLEECEKECLRNCSCNAYSVSDVRNGGTGCLIWHGILMDTQKLSQEGQDIYVRVDAIELETYARKSKRSALAMSWKVGITVTCVILLIALLIVLSVCFIRIKKRRDEIIEQEAKLNSPTEEQNGENRAQSSLPFFSVKTITTATNNFSDENQLGQGGFGSVYKGTLINGEEIAVKRLSQDSGQGTQEFKNEIKLIAKLQHRNLVKLLGYCIHKEERMLIYEYLPNKSLNFFLFDRSQRMPLDWDTRFNIIFGIARGLLYLHQDSRLKIIHRDLKASNVLLDATMNPKISDFGMARIFGENQIQARTRRIVGTYGYMSPEYAMVGQYSTKSDVFSFGVLLLEIISGKRNTDSDKERASPNLIGQVWDLWREEKALEIVDSTLGESYPLDIALRCIQIGLLCVQESALYRPSMLEVVFMLGNEVTIPSPHKPAFLFNSNIENSESSASGDPSVNTISDTTISAR
ncbi:G-type lectin S-receptor-like serine/threonine-protein kinase At1g11410 [Neltuma alba]|uniref:G-type lectin S-receptor-like serine/threonine-protein kinase At1g11410 n=1 Tax=Neltuma alba TaxID=207710 RepID=UPI0010A2C976|nr:G-type lectin S-receptor-like serine/threonine-protein kinase At1g11410 [Prosopis alba]